MTKLRKDWAWKMQMSLGYMVVEDDESLRAFNKCIKSIIQSERQRKNKEPKYIEPLHWKCLKCGCSHTTKDEAINCNCRQYKVNE